MNLTNSQINQKQSYEESHNIINTLLITTFFALDQTKMMVVFVHTARPSSFLMLVLVTVNLYLLHSKATVFVVEAAETMTTTTVPSSALSTTTKNTNNHKKRPLSRLRGIGDKGKFSGNGSQ